MKKLLITAAAVVLATSAYATDLPSKKKAPAAPAAAPAVAATAASSADNSISVETGYEANDGKYGYNDRNKNVYGITATHNIGGGVFVGAGASTSQTYDQGAIKQNLEATVGYKLPSVAGIDLKGSASVGERFVSGGDFAYYALRGSADYKINDTIAINAFQYRYRNAFDAANDYQSHQIGTGVTYSFAKDQAVYGKVYRNLDKDYNTTDNGLVIGYKVAF